MGQGFATALDTLCSQSFTGATDPFAVGKHLQRAIVVSFILSIPISVLWWFTEPIFLFVGQDPAVCSMSATIIRWMIPGLFPNIAGECLRRYLQGQKIMKPSLYVLMIAAPLNIFLQWLLVWSPIGIGLIGSPIGFI